MSHLKAHIEGLKGWGTHCDTLTLTKKGPKNAQNRSLSQRPRHPRPRAGRSAPAAPMSRRREQVQGPGQSAACRLRRSDINQLEADLVYEMPSLQGTWVKCGHFMASCLSLTKSSGSSGSWPPHRSVAITSRELHILIQSAPSQDIRDDNVEGPLLLCQPGTQLLPRTCLNAELFPSWRTFSSCIPNHLPPCLQNHTAECHVERHDP